MKAIAIIVLAAAVACANAGYLRSAPQYAVAQPVAYAPAVKTVLAPAPVIRTVSYAPAIKTVAVPQLIRTVAYAPAVKTVVAPQLIRTVAVAPISYAPAPVYKTLSYAPAPVVKTLAYAPAPVYKSVAYAPAPVVKTVAYAPVVKHVVAPQLIRTVAVAPQYSPYGVHHHH